MKTIKEIKGVIFKSSRVNGWYLYKYDSFAGGVATIRGPWNRWISIHEGTDPKSHGNKDNCGMADAQDDAEFVHVAMTELPNLVIEVENLKEKLKTLEQRLAEAEELLEDVALTGEHLEDYCRYIHTGEQCNCMNRHKYNERNNSEKARQYLNKYKGVKSENKSIN